ncbi:MAG: hypothetical protein DI537_05040 [Stutzerimonas stutzeri]|nr:MAG: hypothetical protein DI537_05040 [Stutzerimonas stutzeri]
MIVRKLIFGQALRLLCVVAFMATALSLFANDRSSSWSALISQRKSEIADAMLSLDGKILVMGDSHGEFLVRAAEQCETATVNAAVAGATAGKYLPMLDAMRFSRKAVLAVVTIGTNDTFRRRATTEAEFRSNSRQIIRKASSASAQVLVSAIPLVSPSNAAVFDNDKAIAFSNVLRDECSKTSNCKFIEPHRADRGNKRGDQRARGYLSSDGVHLSNYAALSRQLQICPSDLHQHSS